MRTTPRKLPRVLLGFATSLLVVLPADNAAAQPLLPSNSVPSADQRDPRPVGPPRRPRPIRKRAVQPAPRPYRGPAVVNGLPFPATIPTGSARTVAELLAGDLTDLLNCHYGKFDECAIAVWGRRDPWHMPAEGTALLFDAPWVALWDKYESIGVQIRQTVGPYTNAYPLGAPKLDFYYVMSLQGESYAISLRSVYGHSPQNPATWHVRGCAFCRAYEVLPL